MPTREECEQGQHTVDNQGLCHWCGLLMEPDWYAEYLGVPVESVLEREQPMTKLIEIENVERDYGTNGINAIVESNDGRRFLIQDAFGGIDTLQGGAVRWRHGVTIQLQPNDTFESLRSGEWNDDVTLWDAVTHGQDDSRPVLEVSPESLANAAFRHASDDEEDEIIDLLTDRHSF